MADGGEQAYWIARERYEELSWALVQLESSKRFASSPTRFRGRLMRELKANVARVNEEMNRLEKTRRTDKLEYEKSRQPRVDTDYRFPNGGVVFGEGYHTAAGLEYSGAASKPPIASRKAAIKDLSDRLAENMELVGPTAHTLTLNERVRNSLVAAQIDDCVNLIKSNEPGTPYWRILHEAAMKGKEKYVKLGGQRKDWSEHLALTGAKCERYNLQ